MKCDIHQPVRTCVSCGKKKNKYELIRLFLDREGNLLIDISMEKKGRGIYICDTSSCRKKLNKIKSLNKRFRTDRSITIGSDLIN